MPLDHVQCTNIDSRHAKLTFSFLFLRLKWVYVWINNGSMNLEVCNSIVRRQLDLVEDLYVNDMLGPSSFSELRAKSRMFTRLFREKH